eukprot:9425257-Ditylum_brightwellii.AAC.1
MHSTHKGRLPIPGVSPSTQHTHIFPDYKSGSLLSVGQLCDDRCVGVLTKNKVCILKEDKISTQTFVNNSKLILDGNRDPNNGLWLIPLQENEPIYCTNNVYELTTNQDLVKYLHVCRFSPTKHAWKEAVNAGFFTMWSGLTAELIEKHLPKSPATVIGHLKQQQQNVRSTKPPSEDDENEETMEKIFFCAQTWLR